MKTKIQIDQETARTLKKLKKTKLETYNEIILRLIKFYGRWKKDENKRLTKKH